MSVKTPPLQSGSSLKLPTGQFLNGRPSLLPGRCTQAKKTKRNHIINIFIYKEKYLA
jgi:hypothetical protein